MSHDCVKIKLHAVTRCMTCVQFQWVFHCTREEQQEAAERKMKTTEPHLSFPLEI